MRTLRCALRRWEQLLRRLNISKPSIRRLVAAELLYRRQSKELVTEQQALQERLAFILGSQERAREQQQQQQWEEQQLQRQQQQQQQLGEQQQQQQQWGQQQQQQQQWGQQQQQQQQEWQREGHLLLMEASTSATPAAYAGHNLALQAASAPLGIRTSADERVLSLTDVDAIAAALQRNLEKQKLLYVEHVGYCFRGGFTPMEAVQVHLACYPYCFSYARAIYACLVP